MTINFLVRLPLRRPGGCSRDKASLSPEQTAAFSLFTNKPRLSPYLHTEARIYLSLAETGVDRRQIKFVCQKFNALYLGADFGGRGCDEAVFSEKNSFFSVKRGEVFSK